MCDGPEGDNPVLQEGMEGNLGGDRRGIDGEF